MRTSIYFTSSLSSYGSYESKAVSDLLFYEFVLAVLEHYTNVSWEFLNHRFKLKVKNTKFDSSTFRDPVGAATRLKQEIPLTSCP
jgi:hypothetical protein